MPLTVAPALAPGGMARLPQPEIAADGLRLRPWQPDDRPAVLAGYADPAIRRWHCRTMDDDEARGWIAAWPERWRRETGAGWAMVDGCEVLGQISLRRLELADGLAEVSYWVLPAARGRRSAPRALSALAGWCFTTLGLHRVELSHSTANPASCRVAQRAGFLAEGTMRGAALHADGWHDMHVHARLATDAA
ncbi:GNAT family N-acetyltransferase [Micromonospora sp. NPDC051006]|uniref:GNAT family N-acetyltransferase n=1 Tax=Micromonospora sp. NPDC051006 TaxID=3364283 RepID=UPI0037B588A8